MIVFELWVLVIDMWVLFVLFVEVIDDFWEGFFVELLLYFEVFIKMMISVE